MIWVIGSKGMLGQEICRLLDICHLDYVGTDLDVSILDYRQMTDFIQMHEKIFWIINCSAYTAVDKAEADSEMAYKINQDGVANIAKIAKKNNMSLIHLSTDYVFDGSSKVPLKEEADTAPIGIYGKSKLAGEQEIQSICSRFFIIRTAWLYGKYGNNFIYTMLRLMNSKEKISVVDDQVGSPSHTLELASLIILIIQKKSSDYGIYHYSGIGQASWYDFACEIYRLGKEAGLIEGECEISPCSSDQYPTPAKRPAWSLLNKAKIERTYGFIPHNWEIELQHFIQDLAKIKKMINSFSE